MNFAPVDILSFIEYFIQLPNLDAKKALHFTQFYPMSAKPMKLAAHSWTRGLATHRQGAELKKNFHFIASISQFDKFYDFQK